MNVEFIPLPLKGLLLFKPIVIADERGYFYESFRHELWQAQGVNPDFVQENQSLSRKNVLRGLHFQVPPSPQAKLVRVIKGSVLDVAVDLRKNSETYGQHFSTILSSENFLQFYIPEGFAHGFLTLEDGTIFSYKCSAYYNPILEMGLPWNDPDLSIEWPDGNYIIAAKDEKHLPFKNFQSPFSV